MLKRNYQALLDSYLPQRPIFDSSTGVFLQSELELLNPTLHMPLTWTTFADDLLPRAGYTIDDEYLSWTNSNFGQAGSFSATGKNWLGIEAQDSADISLATEKQVIAPGIWSGAVSWTFIELSRSQKLQRPIDVDKMEALRIKWNLDVDNQAYLGDTAKGLYGLYNADLATGKDWQVTNSTNAITGGWVALFTSSPSTAADLILADLNALDESVYTNSGWNAPATEFHIPASVWFTINQPLVISGVPIAMSVREYFEKNSIAASQGKKVTLKARKWNNATIPGNNYGNNVSANKVIAFSEMSDLAFEYTPLQNTPVEIRGLRQSVTYYGGLGGVEVIRPSTIGYISGV